MKNRSWIVLVGMMILSLFVVAACGQQAAPPPAAAPTEPAAAAEPTAATDSNGGGGGEPTTLLKIANDGENLNFDTNELGPVPAGEEITLEFSNDSMVNPHNFILLNTDDEAEAEAFVVEGEKAPAADNHLPDDLSLVIAHTNLLGSNENGSDTIDFTIPEPGTYIYLCTVPGHYAGGMHGILTVQ